MNAAKLIAALDRLDDEAQRSDPPAPTGAAKLIALLSETNTPAGPKVHHLRFGQTRRAEGYDSEAEYLDSQRRPQYMRPNPKGRYTYVRFDPAPSEIQLARERLNTRWNGPKGAAIQRRKARAAQAVAPNVILGA